MAPRRKKLRTRKTPFVFKMVLIGDAGVGKTALMRRYMKRKFEPTYTATLSVNFACTSLQVENSPITLQICDTAGEEECPGLCAKYYKGADCCVLVYDVNVLKSFENLNKWYDGFLAECQAVNRTTFPFVLLGNKTDIDHGAKRAVAKKDAKKWCASRHNMPYFETSALYGTNVHAGFVRAAELAVSEDRRRTVFLSIEEAPDLEGTDLEDTFLQSLIAQPEQLSPCAC